MGQLEQFPVSVNTAIQHNLTFSIFFSLPKFPILNQGYYCLEIAASLSVVPVTLTTVSQVLALCPNKKKTVQFVGTTYLHINLQYFGYNDH